jgi:hypothetical protein
MAATTRRPTMTREVVPSDTVALAEGAEVPEALPDAEGDAEEAPELPDEVLDATVKLPFLEPQM